MSSETNESAAHTWPLLALSCITVITPPQSGLLYFAVPGIRLLSLISALIPCTHPFSYLPPTPAFPLCLLLSRSHKATSTPPPPPPAPLSRTSPFFSPPPVTSSAVADARDPAGKALSLLSDRPQSQSLPLSGAEVYTHGKLIPVPCRLHIVLMSKVVRCVATGGDIFERQTHCGKPLHWETTRIGEAVESGGP